MHKFVRLYVGSYFWDQLDGDWIWINFKCITCLLHCVPFCPWNASLLAYTHFSLTHQGTVLSVWICMYVFVHVYYSRTPVVRTSVLAWWQWSSPPPNPEEPDSCPKVASWTTRNVVGPRKPPRLLRRKTRRTRALWICCTPRPFLQHPLRVRGHTHTHTECGRYYHQALQ